MIEKKKNVVISSETGSGKTMAYFLPLLDRIAKESQERKIQRADGTYYIFLVPTRELCMQSLEFFKKVTKNFPFIVCGMMTGGENSKTQKKALRKGFFFLEKIVICRKKKYLFSSKKKKVLLFLLQLLCSCFIILRTHKHSMFLI